MISNVSKCGGRMLALAISVLYSTFCICQTNPETLKLLRLQAEQGDVTVQHRLGVMYFQGDGVAQDYAEAAHWLSKAAGHGDVKSQAILGGLYEAGKGWRKITSKRPVGFAR